MLPSEITTYEGRISGLDEDELTAELEKKQALLGEYPPWTGSDSDVIEQYRYDYIADEIVVLENALARKAEKRKDEWLKRTAARARKENK